jgi:hypothetical protein
MKRYINIFALLIVSLSILSFQDLSEQFKKIQKALFAYGQESPTTHLYVHLDKNIYMPGETIWLKAYFPSSSQLQNDALYVRLVNDAKKTVLEKEFPAYDIRSNGDITLPDSLKEGTYQLYAYTDKMINFDVHDVFSQEIKVVANAGSRLRLSANVIDTVALQPQKNVQVLCALTSNGKAVKDAKGTYNLKREDGRIISQGKLVTDDLGNAVISFVYPAINPLESLKINAQFSKDNSAAELILNLPPIDRQVVIEADAEGGNLVQNIASKILIETKDKQGQPVSVPVLLKKGDIGIAKTITNTRGMGVLSFTPHRGESYSIVASQGATVEKKPLSIPILPAGWTIAMRNIDNKPTVIIYNQGMPDHSMLVMRSLQEIIWYKEISVKSGDSLSIVLPHTDTIKQVLDLALFDGNGKLCNERLFLSHKQENYQVAFKLEKTTYGLREKVRVTLKVTDAQGNPVESNLSVAAVSQKALIENTYKTILNASYSNLNKPDQSYQIYNDQEKDFNDFLISKNWWRNSWPEILSYQPKGNVSVMANTAGVFGHVKPKNPKRSVKIQNLFLFTSAGPRPVQIQPNGNFSIPASDLVAEQDKSNYILVNEDFRNQYNIEVKNYTLDADARITKSGILDKPIEYLTATKPPLIPPVTGMINLKEVRITSKRSEDDAFTFHKFENIDPRYCKDYVCQFGTLNCAEHPTGGTPPVLGQSYPYKGRGGYVYTHCILSDTVPSNSFMIKTINSARDFPFQDYEKNPNSTPEFLSTMYWNPNITTNKAGEASFEFYTSDLKGTFKIIAQGLEINSARAIFGKTAFAVE